ncbi:PREDICTED: uncharacterized protein LOC109468538 [Branchiostoma belcheri]|uniref:Uncharacterized protein LOC109468538 n=1 Tax=Branchiostoma belcheri TaxID=7741 RepID=A0A6P4Y0C3_BRABE|nr:PREDICTED: uncharacterized protein LOC109468538 [Branchiostoma belcheri]
MCLSCGDGVRLIPLLWMLTMPMYGSFLGPEPVLRLSLMLMLHAAVGAALPIGLSFIAPYVQVGALVLVLSLPVNLMPYALVWLYDKLLLVSEPALLLVEAAEVVRMTLRCSELALQHIEERPVFIKTLILAVSAVSYVISAVLAAVLYSRDSSTLNWLLLVMLVAAVGLAVLTYIVDEGVISNAAVVTMAGFVMLWLMDQELALAANPRTAPDEWAGASWGDYSYLQVLLSLAGSTMAKAFSGQKETDWSSLQEEDAEGSPSSISAWTSPLAVKLSIILVYTQLVVHSIQMGSTGSHTAVTDPGSHTAVMDPGSHSAVWQGLGLMRVLQIGALVGIYLQRLYSSEDGPDF